MTEDGRVDDRFVAFGDALRRRVLARLCAASDDTDGVAFEALVSSLADEESPDSAGYARTRLDLLHVHLPKLEEAELVERDGGRVRLAVASGTISDGLRLAERFETA